MQWPHDEVYDKINICAFSLIYLVVFSELQLHHTHYYLSMFSVLLSLHCCLVAVRRPAAIYGNVNIFYTSEKKKS